MKRSFSILMMVVAGFLGFTAGEGRAALLLSLDARNPGPNPSSEWQDLSGVNAPLVAANSTGGNPVYNAGGQVYEFGRTAQFHWFQTQGADENNFDFPAAPFAGPANPAGEFTVVAYLDNTGYTANTPFYGKGNGVSNHMQLTVNVEGGSDAAYMDRGVGNGSGERAIAGGTGPAAANQLDLYVFHFDGKQAAADWSIYVNGGLADISSGVGGAANSGDAYPANASLLRIGTVEGAGDRFFGDIRLIEVYSGSTIDNNLVTGMTPAQYSAYRFQNLGQTVQEIPEPSSLMLVVLGGALIMVRRQRYDG